jgi:SNF2 family DNA or RNA helicase
VDTVAELVEDIGLDEPVVIFCRFRPEIPVLIRALKKIGRIPCEISGAVDEQELFETKQADVAVVQIQAGCEGLDNLKRARYCIYLSMGFSNGQYRQSRARVWRDGQTRKVFYYHILANGTVDKKIIAALKAKQRIVDFVVEDIIGSGRTEISAAGQIRS